MATRKKRKTVARPDEMRPEYDFREGVRGKHVRRLRPGTIVVTLDPDVAKAYRRLRRSIVRCGPSWQRFPARRRGDGRAEGTEIGPRSASVRRP